MEDRDDESVGVAVDEPECRISVPASMRHLFVQRGMRPTHPDERRRFARFHMPCRALMTIESGLANRHGLDPDDGTQQHVVFTLDVSRSGIGFLHHQQLYPGDVVRLQLPNGPMRARVERCRHHNATCWQIGGRLVVERAIEADAEDEADAVD